MTSYSVEIKSSAQKELDAIDDAKFARIDRRDSGAGRQSRPGGCKKLKGHKDQWRIRAGDWRVVFIIDDEGKQITVSRVAHRREVYD